MINNKIAFLAIVVAVLIIASGRCRSLSHGIVPQSLGEELSIRAGNACRKGDMAMGEFQGGWMRSEEMEDALASWLAI